MLGSIFSCVCDIVSINWLSLVFLRFQEFLFSSVVAYCRVFGGVVLRFEMKGKDFALLF